MDGGRREREGDALRRALSWLLVVPLPSVKGEVEEFRDRDVACDSRKDRD